MHFMQYTAHATGGSRVTGDIPGDIPVKMDTEEECILLLLLNRRRQRRQRRDRRWYVRPLNTTRDQDGEFVSLVLPMRSLDEERHFQLGCRRQSLISFRESSHIFPTQTKTTGTRSGLPKGLRLLWDTWQPASACKRCTTYTYLYNIVEIMYTRPHRQRIVLHGSARRVSKIGTTRFATHRRIMAAEV